MKLEYPTNWTQLDWSTVGVRPVDTPPYMDAHPMWALFLQHVYVVDSIKDVHYCGVHYCGYFLPGPKVSTLANLHCTMTHI